MASSVLATFPNGLHKVMSTIPESAIMPPTFDTLRIHSRDLASYRRLSALTDLVNNAFTAAGRLYPGLYDPERKRFEKPSNFLEEMGPDGVTFITFASNGGDSGDEPEMVATTSYKPMSGHLKESTRSLRDMLEEMLKAEKWVQDGEKDHASRPSKNDAVPGLDTQLKGEPYFGEHTQSPTPVVEESRGIALKVAVCVVAVAPAWQKHGLASELLSRIVDEINSEAIAHGREDFTLVLNTMKEINGSYWTSKGFKTREEQEFPPGIFGSRDGFTLSRMSRLHLVN